MAKPIITQLRLKELFTYNPESGLFTRNKPSSKYCNKKYQKGAIAGSVIKKGYIAIRMCNGHQYLAHRLAFLYMDGFMPDEVDHINRQRTDNKWSNLKAVSRTDNMKNKRLYSNNTTGVSGVRLIGNQYLSRIGVNGKKHNLYYGSDFFEACCARKSSENKHGYSNIHGDIR